METSLFGVKGTDEKVIGDGCYHPVKVVKNQILFDKQGEVYVSLCVHLIGEHITLYPMFKATPSNVKGLLIGIGKENKDFFLHFHCLFAEDKTYEMRFDRRDDGSEILSIMGSNYAGEISYNGEGINNDIIMLSAKKSDNNK